MRNSDFLRLHLMGANHRELFLVASDSDAETAIRRIKSLRPQSAPLLSDNRFEEVSKLLSDTGIRLVSALDAEYPIEFLQLPRRPFLLYIRGKLPASEIAISMVGSRKPSNYGIEVSRRFVSDLVRRGISIISWGAIWIDSVAHRSAIEAWGRTYAFVWTGIDIDYPRTNSALFRDIVSSGGGVVSAFPPGVSAQPYHFPIRNALVASYSVGTIVTEAAKKSGSLITAKLALEFGKEVFAVPWDIFRPGSEGTNSLIRDGMAKCVLSTDDVLNELHGFENPSQNTLPGLVKPRWQCVSPVWLELLRLGPSYPEEISETLRIPFQEVLSELSSLELRSLALSETSWAYRAISG